jgi:predicted metal-dependent hydrolase
MNDVPPYQVVVSRRTTLALEINDRAEVVVRAPFGLSDQTIEQFIHQKARWIREHIERILKIRTRHPLPVYQNGALFLFFGQEYPLHFVHHNKPLFFKDGFFLPEIQRHHARELMTNWYRLEAKKWLTKRVHELASRHHIVYTNIRITGAMTRWGSCGPGGTLNFSWRIIMAPHNIVDYVIAHELAHVSIKNHSQRFWRRVEELYGDYKTAHQWLKDHGSRLKL